MIDFRYHLVSIVSIFLALAVGIVLGAGPLKGELGNTLNKEVAGLRQDKADLNKQLQEASAGVRGARRLHRRHQPDHARRGAPGPPGRARRAARLGCRGVRGDRRHPALVRGGRRLDDLGVRGLGDRRRGHRGHARRGRRDGSRARPAVDVSTAGRWPRATCCWPACSPCRPPTRLAARSRRPPPRRRLDALAAADLIEIDTEGFELADLVVVVSGVTTQGDARRPAAGRRALGRPRHRPRHPVVRGARGGGGDDGRRRGVGHRDRAQRRDRHQGRLHGRQRRWSDGPGERRARPRRSRRPATSGSTAWPPGPTPPTRPSRRREPGRHPRGGSARRGRRLRRAPCAHGAGDARRAGSAPTTPVTRSPCSRGRPTSPAPRWARPTSGPAGVGGGRWAPGPSAPSTTSPATAPARGCRGHLGAAAQRPGDDRAGEDRRHRRHRPGRRRARRPRAATTCGALDTLVGGAVVAGAANLANLLDLRPGPGPQGHRARVAAAAAGAVARRRRPGAPPRRAPRSACCGPDLAGTAMLGDTGANAAGALVGTALLERTGRRGRVAALVVLAGLTLASEKVSLHPGHRVDPRAARARRLGPARTMTRSTLRLRHRGGRRADRGHDAARPHRRASPGSSSSPRRCAPAASAASTRASTPSRTCCSRSRRAASSPPSRSRSSPHQLGRGPARPGRPHGIRAAHRGPCSCSCRWRPALAASPRRSRRGSSSRSDPRAAEVGRHPAADLRRAGAALRLGIILTGLLQAHRRFLAAALAPLASSIVVLVVLPLVRLDRRRPGRPVAGQRRGHPGARLGHHARGRRAVGAARRAGDAHRLALAARRCGCRATTPAGSAPSPGPGSSPCSPSRRPSSSRCGCREQSGDRGTFTVYTYAQAVYLLPYAVLAVPVATSAFPALAARTGAGEDVTATLARSLRAVLVLTGAVGGRAHRRGPGHRRVLLAARRPARRRRHEHRRPRRAARRAHGVRARAWSASASPRC